MGSFMDVKITKVGGLAQIRKLHSRRMTNKVKYGYYMERGWQIGSDMDVLLIKRIRNGCNKHGKRQTGSDMVGT